MKNFKFLCTCAIFTAALLPALTGCDMKKKLDNMSDTTEKMGRSTDNLEKSSDQIAGRTEHLYTGMREVEAVRMQQDSFKLIIEEKGVTAKANAALVYYSAMEFQHWYPTNSESIQDRDLLFLKAVDLFFSKVEDLIQDDMPVTPFLVPSNEWTALSVLAVGMSKVHPAQYERAKEFGFEAVSFYDVLKIGLAAKADYLAGKQIPEYQLKILRNETKLRYILQLRQNFFKALVLAQLTKLEEGFFDIAWMGTFGWSVQMDNMQEAEIGQLNEWLWKSLETQNYLMQIGEKVEPNGTFDYLYGRGELRIRTEITISATNMFPKGKLVPLSVIEKRPALDLFLGLLPQTLGQNGPWLNQNYQGQ